MLEYLVRSQGQGACHDLKGPKPGMCNHHIMKLSSDRCDPGLLYNTWHTARDQISRFTIYQIITPYNSGPPGHLIKY